MQINFKSIGYSAAVGAAAGATIGAGVGLINVPVLCGVEAMRTVFLHQFFNGHSSSNLDAGVAAFQDCQTVLPLASAVVFGVGGCAIGLIYGVAKEVFKNYSIQIQRVPAAEMSVQKNPIDAAKADLHTLTPKEPVSLSSTD